MAYRFSGGTKVAHHKHSTERKPVEKLPMPAQLVVPLQQHLGAPTTVQVKKGDVVKKGQVIGAPNGFVSAPIHAPTSGTVAAVETRPHPVIGKGMAVVIDVDGQDAWAEGLPKPARDWRTATRDEIRAAAREAGIVGMGGATFPTHVKLAPPDNKPIDMVLINGAECEPYLTSDHAAMLARAEDIVIGAKLCAKATGAAKAAIGIEENKPDAIARFRELAAKDGVEVFELSTRYPQGAERSLIYAITKRELPAGKLPMDVGVVVQNVNTVIALADAVRTGLPVTDKIVTVTGSCVREPKNVLAPIGAPFSALVEFCGGFSEAPAKILMGGPMMGIAQYTLDVPVVKGTSGIVCLTEAESPRRPILPCIRCGRCVSACPMGLAPTDIAEAALKGLFADAEMLHALDCVECGCCTFECPAHRPMVQTIRTAKAVIREMEKKRKAHAG
ncbi:MAG: electron transport complex subunit RsxC [Myxococcales bacterium]|nr:MAG: electron transport complex subunit RsxC [Myxococcales bacterium]